MIPVPQFRLEPAIRGPMERARLALIIPIGLLVPACTGSGPIDLGVHATDADDAQNTDASTSEASDTSTPDAPSGELAEPPACTAIWPHDFDFGGTAVGTCTTHDLHIEAACLDGLAAELSAQLGTGSDPAFAMTSAPAAGSVIGPAGLTQSIIYCPTVASAAAIGTVVLVVAPADAVPGDPRTLSHAVALRGRSGGVLTPCPAIRVTEGEEVLPLTKLHLIGSDPAVNATTYQWRVDAPAGSASRLFPSANVPDPTYEANVVGTYTFHLTVGDADGNSCTADQIVHVVGDTAIYVELHWRTPGDLDETDTGPNAGSDLDLHFAHPFATGPDLDHDGEPDPWFHDLFDCFWSNDQPNWGSMDLGADDNPSLDRDGNDGAGPEAISLGVPENVCYRIGVHVFNDHGFGASFATVRIFLSNTLAFEAADVRLANHDMWTVTSLCWPSAAPPTLTRVCAETTTACASDSECAPATCGPRIAHDYVNPIFTPP